MRTQGQLGAVTTHLYSTIRRLCMRYVPVLHLQAYCYYVQWTGLAWPGMVWFAPVPLSLCHSSSPEKIIVNSQNIYCFNTCTVHPLGARDGVVVEALGYKQEGRGFDS
jgi:hypothetical protein